MKKNQTVWAYELCGHDDGSYMLGNQTYKAHPERGEWHFGTKDQPHPATCPRCGGKVDSDYIDPAFRVKKRRRDITCTYDGCLMVSARLRAALELGGAGCEDFAALPADPDFFWLRPRRTLEYAAGERARPCPSCGQHADEVVPIPQFMTGLAAPLGAGAYRSTVSFGSTPLKSFMVILGVDTALAIPSKAWVGGDLHPVIAEPPTTPIGQAALPAGA